MSDIGLTVPEKVADTEGCPVVGLPFGLSERIGQTGWRRFVSAAVTIGIHVGVVAVFLLATSEARHVARPAAQEMTVALLADQPKPTKVSLAMAKPTLVQPQAVTMVQPVFQTQTAATSDAISVPPSTSARTPAGNTADLKNIWAAKLIARLSAMKRYPREAVAAHDQGVVWLHFVIDRAGHVLRADIQQSSGYDVLDREALALAYRAAPLPAPPAGLPGSSFDLALPIRFALH